MAGSILVTLLIETMARSEAHEQGQSEQADAHRYGQQNVGAALLLEAAAMLAITMPAP